MRINSRTILLALPLAFASCSDYSDTDIRPATGTISVSVGSGPKIDIESEDKTRTELGEDGVTVKWSSDDQIALWAVNSRSETTLSKQVFKLYHYNAEYNTARFTGNITPMPEDTYTYYAVSPAPAESNGTQATYLIPAVQNGAFNGAWDVMVAEPVEAPALEQNQTGERVQFQFRHKVHVLKIRIPKNNLGEKVSEITLAFPQPVTGHMTVDATDPDAAPTLTSGSSTLTLRFDEPKDAGDVVFAVIAPTEFTADQKITITAAGATRQSRPREIDGKEFSAGHTTPIAYNIPKVGPTTLRFSLSNTGETTLGERISSLVLTGPEGSDLGNGSNVHTFTVDNTGNYDLVFEDFPEGLAGATFNIGYESENALISDSFTISELKIGGMNEVATLSVPYLLEETFKTVKSFGRDDNPNVGDTTIASGDKTVYELSGEDFGLSAGWTGTRVGALAGTAVRICGRWQGQTFANNRDAGRLDSAPLRGIKEGKTVKVSVYYEFKGGRWSWSSSGTPNGNAVYSYGYTTKQNGMAGSVAIEKQLGSDVVLPNTGHGDSTNAQNYANIDQHNSFEIPTAGNNCRLSWKVTSTMSNKPFLGANANFWLYLDNIKVSIVNE